MDGVGRADMPQCGHQLSAGTAAASAEPAPSSDSHPTVLWVWKRERRAHYCLLLALLPSIQHHHALLRSFLLAILAWRRRGCHGGCCLLALQCAQAKGKPPARFVGPNRLRNRATTLASCLKTIKMTQHLQQVVSQVVRKHDEEEEAAQAAAREKERQESKPGPYGLREEDVFAAWELLSPAGHSVLTKSQVGCACACRMKLH